MFGKFVEGFFILFFNVTWVPQHVLKVCWSCDPPQSRRFNQSRFPWAAFREQSCYTHPRPLSALREKIEYLGNPAQDRAPCPVAAWYPWGAQPDAPTGLGRCLILWTQHQPRKGSFGQQTQWHRIPSALWRSTPKFHQLLQELANLPNLGNTN